MVVKKKFELELELEGEKKLELGFRVRERKMFSSSLRDLVRVTSSRAVGLFFFSFLLPPITYQLPPFRQCCNDASLHPITLLHIIKQELVNPLNHCCNLFFRKFSKSTMCSSISYIRPRPQLLCIYLI